MTTQSLTFSSGLGPLVITNSPPPASFTGFVIPERGMSYPDFPMRLTFAPDSDIPGKQLLAAVLDAGTMPLEITVHGEDTANLQIMRRILEGVLAQPTYTVTISVDGQDEVYDAFPAWPSWGPIDSGKARAHIATATVTLTVNPPTGA